jgi:hypothetical protein
MTAKLLLLVLMLGALEFLGGCSQAHSQHLVCRMVPCRATQQSDAAKPWPDCEAEDQLEQTNAVQGEEEPRGVQVSVRGRWAQENGPKDCSF